MNTKYHTRNTQCPATRACQRRLRVNFKRNTLPGSSMKFNFINKFSTVFLCLILTNIGCSPSFRTLERVRELNANNEFEKSIDACQKVLKTDHRNLQFLRELGIAYYNLGLAKNNVALRDSAREIFMRMVNVDSANVFALKSLGLIYYDENNCESSLQHFSKALSYKTLDGQTYFNNSSQLDDFDIDSGNLFYCKARTCAYLNCENKKGLKDIEFCIQVGYSLSQSYLVAAILYLNEGLVEQSCDYFNRAKLMGNEEAGIYLSMFCNG